MQSWSSNQLIQLQGVSILTKHGSESHHGHTLFSTWKCLCLIQLAIPSSVGAGLVDVMGPSWTCQQELDGLNTLTRWSVKMLGSTHPSVPGGQSRGEKLRSGLTSLTRAWDRICQGPRQITHPSCANNTGYFFLAVQAFPPFPKTQRLPRLGLKHSSLPKGCTLNWTPPLRSVSSARPAGCLTLLVASHQSHVPH